MDLERLRARRFLAHLGLVVITLVAMIWPVGDSVAGDSVVAIRIEGIRRIESDTVRSHLALEVGDRFDSQAIRKSIESLHKTGFFKDVVIVREGDELVVRVVENPVIFEISFEGNDAFEKEDLEKLLKLKTGDILDRARMERDLGALRQSYRIKGLFMAKVAVDIKPLEENRVALVYRIDEGEKSKVSEIRVVGNEAIPDKDLTKNMLIQPTGWLSWITDKDTYDREKLLYDQTQLRDLYLDRGYARVRVDSSVAELTPDRKAFVITHTVHEGKRYRFAEVSLSGDFDELPEAELKKALTVAQGDWYSRKKMRETIEALTDLIGNFGYAFLNIEPKTEIDDEALTIAVRLNIKKGRRVYLNRIEIAGNTRTRDEVIRREIGLSEGDRFSAAKMRRSKKDLEALNFFETVEITTPDSGMEDRVNLQVKVSEKPTGTFTIGAGYSSTESFIATASVSQNNFLGRGQRVVFSFGLSGQTTEFDLSFTEPYFMDRNMSAGVDLYNRKVDRKAISSFKQSTSGAAFHLGFPLSEELKNTLSYGISRVEIEDVGEFPSRVIRDQASRSPYFQSMISDSLNWNDLDDRLFPTNGRQHRLSVDLSGLGGDVRFARALTDHHLYHRILGDEDWVGHWRGRVGVVEGLGQDVPIFERFQLGGAASLRGFKPGGIGPQTVEGDAFGGVHFEQASTEVFFPILDLSDKGVRGVAFLDAGFLGDWDLPTDVRALDSIRVATGFGVHWNSPFGPLRFTFGFPLAKEDADETRVFDFSMGTTL
ncbi:MAG: outer membrane protein assembly factor BamA [Magnetococcales bacterium]|nr:outer membrane protein assembly factor BamA [Magnetococcales bacterium]